MKSAERLILGASAVGLAIMLNYNGDQGPKLVDAGGPNATPNSAPTPTSTPNRIVTQIAELQATATALAEKARKEKESADSQTQVAAQSTPGAEVTITSNPNQTNVDIDINIDIPSPAPLPTAKPEVIVVTTTPTVATTSELKPSEAVTAIETIVQSRLNEKASATARAAGNTPTATSTSIPAATLSPEGIGVEVQRRKSFWDASIGPIVGSLLGFAVGVLVESLGRRRYTWWP